MKLGKTLKNMDNVLAKIEKKSIFSKIKPISLTNEEMHFIFFRDLSSILRSKCIFMQYLKFHAFSILATQLTGF